jgi:hypothetical protein
LEKSDVMATIASPGKALALEQLESTASSVTSCPKKLCSVTILLPALWLGWIPGDIPTSDVAAWPFIIIEAPLLLESIAMAPSRKAE